MPAFRTSASVGESMPAFCTSASVGESMPSFHTSASVGESMLAFHTSARVMEGTPTFRTSAAAQSVPQVFARRCVMAMHPPQHLHVHRNLCACRKVLPRRPGLEGYDMSSTAVVSTPLAAALA
jgi:hypothetical protein